MLRLFELPETLRSEVDLATRSPVVAGMNSEELPCALEVRAGDAIYDYAWYPFMHSAQPASCCFLSSCRDHPIQLWDAYGASGAQRTWRTITSMRSSPPTPLLQPDRRQDLRRLRPRCAS